MDTAATGKSGDCRMEGWLYMIRSNRSGLQYSRKRYFVFEQRLLKSFKCVPSSSNHQDLLRSAVIDSCIRVTDNGRENIHGKVFYILTIYNTSSHDDQLKLGASSPDEAARWIEAFQEVALEDGPNSRDKEFGCWKSPCRFNGSPKIHQSNTINRNLYSSAFADPESCDVMDPSQWTIFGCQNGLRLFQESQDMDSSRKDDHRALMAVGVVEGTSEEIFQTLMSLGPFRSEWDFCFYKGSVVEHIDGHTDIIHEQFRSTWMPWGMKRRDLVLRRFWRRDNDGTYVILYHSVFHKRCPTQKGYVRACLKFGGYVISPTNDGKQSVVRHMLAIDWKFWRSYCKLSQSATIKMLESIAALREMFKTKSRNISSSDFSSDEVSSEIQQCPNGVGSKVNIWKAENNGTAHGNGDADLNRTISSLGDDEFFDVPEPSDYDHLENDWTSGFGTESQDLHHSSLSAATGFVQEFHDLAVQKKGYSDVQEMGGVGSESCWRVQSLVEDPTGTIPSSYSTADPSTFLIRDKSYLTDKRKAKAKGTWMQLVGAEWILSNKREDDFGRRPNSIVQVDLDIERELEKYATKGGPEFFLIVNFQMPGPPKQNVILYYMMSTPLEDTPLLESFVNGDDAFRSSRFKLIPCVPKGPWIVKQTVKNRPYLLGKYIDVKYYRGNNYLEVALDIGSSSFARRSANLVTGYLSHVVTDLAFLIQANTYEELPECLIGTCRLNHLAQSNPAPPA